VGGLQSFLYEENVAMNDLYNILPVFAQNVACSASGIYRAYTRYSPRFHRALEQLQDTANASLDELHALQWSRLRKLVERARAHVPHYCDLDPPVESGDPLRSIEETLAHIPCLEKNIYRENAETFIASDIPRRNILHGKTSGTTGTALSLYYSAQTLAEEYATVWRLRKLHNVDIRDRHLTFGGQLIVPISQANPPFWRNNAYQRQILFSIYHMTKLNQEAYVNAIHSHAALYADGYPSALYQAAQSMLELDRPLPPDKLRAVFTSSESLLAYQRNAIKEAFGAPVWDRYGTAEFAVSMTECPERNLHVDMEYCIVEVEVREETDEFVRGPLLVTGLANNVTPFLRYRIGDSGTKLKSPCPCGRSGDVFLDVDGRSDDYVVTPDGRRIGRLDHIFKDQRGVIEAQIRQDETDAIDVLYVPAADFNEKSEEALRREIRSRVGDEIKIRLAPVDAIPREANGKFRAVKSRVGRAKRVRRD
jgi:phenylacetate-CoA ligase